MKLGTWCSAVMKLDTSIGMAIVESEMWDPEAESVKPIGRSGQLCHSLTVKKPQSVTRGINPAE